MLRQCAGKNYCCKAKARLSWPHTDTNRVQKAVKFTMTSLKSCRILYPLLLNPNATNHVVAHLIPSCGMPRLIIQTPNNTFATCRKTEPVPWGLVSTTGAIRIYPLVWLLRWAIHIIITCIFRLCMYYIKEKLQNTTMLWLKMIQPPKNGWLEY